MKVVIIARRPSCAKTVKSRPSAGSCFSIALVERIFQAGKPKLLGIAWFAYVYRFISLIHNAVLTAIRATNVYKAVKVVSGAVRSAISALRDRLTTR